MKIEERRHHPRVWVEFPAIVSNLAGLTMEAKLLDLSLGGFKMAADDALIEHIQSDNEEGTSPSPEELRLEFTVSLEAENLRIGVHCRVAHKRRISQHSYQVGLRTLEYEEESENKLQRYIASRLK